MPDAIENYNPQTMIAKQKRQSLIVWGAVLLIVISWLAAILAAPVAKANGFNSFAESLYSFFGHVCHQISARSFHIHEQQFAVCARCFGFYGGLLAGIGIYPFFRRVENTDSFPRFWLFAAMIPMGIDFSLTFFNVWENTHWSRFATGAILGTACAFFIVPPLVEINIIVREKIRRR